MMVNKRDHGKLLVYSNKISDRIENSNHFLIVVSSSEGFSWNQDIFASQYQQNFRVVYDGYEDTYDGLLTLFEGKIRQLQHQTKENTSYSRYLANSDGKFEIYDDIEVQLKNELSRSRRKSENSVSFVSNSKTGNYNVQLPINIDIDSDTEENTYFKWLSS